MIFRRSGSVGAPSPWPWSPAGRLAYLDVLNQQPGVLLTMAPHPAVPGFGLVLEDYYFLFLVVGLDPGQNPGPFDVWRAPRGFSTLGDQQNF